MTYSRRRFLSITAAAGALGAMAPGASLAARGYEWRGSALGAEARLSILDMDRAAAERLARRTLAEVARLEACFSLYRAESELSRLNAEGRLDHPSHDFRRLLGEALFYWQESEGAFNPAVQPLWSFLRAHFAGRPHAGDPDARALEAVRALADPSRVEIAPGAIRMAEGMALTFNGIGQGYITDRVSELLRQEGCEGVLVALGEWRALPGGAWPVRLPDFDRRLSLSDSALAVSRPAATPLSADGRWHHLIDPASGRPASEVAAVAVRAGEATKADALSTALAIADAGRRARIARRFAGTGLLLETVSGDRFTHGGGV